MTVSLAARPVRGVSASGRHPARAGRGRRRPHGQHPGQRCPHRQERDAPTSPCHARTSCVVAGHDGPPAVSRDPRPPALIRAYPPRPWRRCVSRSVTAWGWRSGCGPTASRPRDPAGRTGIVLVHGLASNARLWDGVAAELARPRPPRRHDRPSGTRTERQARRRLRHGNGGRRRRPGDRRPRVVPTGGGRPVLGRQRRGRAGAPPSRTRRASSSASTVAPSTCGIASRAGRSAPAGWRHPGWRGPRGPTSSAVCAMHTRTGPTKGSTACWPASACSTTAPSSRG